MGSKSINREYRECVRLIRIIRSLQLFHQSVDSILRDMKIYSRDGKMAGRSSGHTKECMMESCRGERIMVRWPDNTRSWPCSAGLKKYKDGWKIR